MLYVDRLLQQQARPQSRRPRFASPKPMFYFDPQPEQDRLLRAWLRFRGHAPSRFWSHQRLVQETERDFKQNGPNLAGFTNFRPADASTEFLQLFLSWYGVGSVEPRRRKFWVAKTKELLAIMKQHAPPLSALPALRRRREAIDARLRRIDDCLAGLSPEAWQELDLSRQQRLQAEEAEAKRAERNKAMLALALDMAMVTTPVLLNRSDLARRQIQRLAPAVRKKKAPTTWQAELLARTKSTVSKEVFGLIMRKVFGDHGADASAWLRDLWAAGVSPDKKFIPFNSISTILARRLKLYSKLWKVVDQILLPTLQTASK